MKPSASILIFTLQVIGVLMIGIGLEMIWEPLSWIYHGIVCFVFGHVLYRAAESEERKK